METIKEIRNNLINLSKNTPMISCVDEIQIYPKSTDIGCQKIFAKLLIRASINQILNAIQSRVHEFDDTVTKYSVEDITTHREINMVITPGYFMNKREFYYDEYFINSINDKMLIFVNKSDPQTKYLKCDMRGGGWYIRQINGSLCEVIHYMHIDIKTLLPSYLLSTFSGKIKNMMIKLKEILE